MMVRRIEKGGGVEVGTYMLKEDCKKRIDRGWEGSKRGTVG